MSDLSIFNQFAPQPEKKKRTRTNNAVIYTRVSTKEQAENNASLETQMKHCLAFAERSKLNIRQYFGGTHESAKSDTDRKEFNRMLKFVKSKKDISYIVVYSLDRFSRTGSSGMQIKDQLKKIGVSVITVSQNIDSSTPSGELQENILLLFSKMDNDLRRDKSVNGMIQKLEDGIWCFQPPLGYSKNYNSKSKIKEMVINEDGLLLKKAFEWKANERISNLAILERLEARGLKINEKTFSRVLRNPFYCGVLVSKLTPNKSYKGLHTPLISKSLFLKVNNVLNEKFEKGKHSTEVQELPLKRFVVCDCCKAPLTGYLVKSKGLYYYKCRTNGCKVNINAKKLNTAYKEILTGFEIKEEYKEPLKEMLNASISKYIQDKAEGNHAIKLELSEINKKIETLQERFAFGKIDDALYEKFITQIQAEKLKIEKQLEQTEIKSSNLQKAIEKAVEISRNISKEWGLASLNRKLTLQKLLFPNGIQYNKEKGVFRTERIGVLFNLILNNINELGENKKGIKLDFSNLIPLGRGGKIRTCDLLLPKQILSIFK
ncbi:hypothetical protein CRYO30217_01848 [Parvicella tangerina]|uniref:Resolvase/invertase-type recombinase catalytic domain-containing protein n=1 Tax=Parvicella tangerina TaxID=2829795 RepID=A0A916JMW6_9FLAO|nr:hypothetical protein CRYO30217_01848 [Parvicella tangerina]